MRKAGAQRENQLVETVLDLLVCNVLSKTVAHRLRAHAQNIGGLHASSPLLALQHERARAGVAFFSVFGCASARKPQVASL